MIDLHAHILPDLDDGAKDWQETLDMCAIALNDGIHTIVATPHVKRGMYTPAKDLILSKVAELNHRLLHAPCPMPPAPRLAPSPPLSNVKSKTLEVTPHVSRPSPLADSSLLIDKKHEPRAMSHEPSALTQDPRAMSHDPFSSRLVPRSLTILPGADNAFEPDILDQLEQGTALYLAHPTNAINAPNAINANNPTNVSREMRSIFYRDPTNPINPTNSFRYVLLELSDYFLLPQVKDLIRKLREKNIVPVLSHPERIAMIQKNHKLLHELIQAGALSQVTAMSITGEFGKEIKKLTRTLIRKNLAHVIASDSHSKDRRPPILSQAVSEVADLIGSDKAELMVQGIPRAIIEGKEVSIN